MTTTANPPYWSKTLCGYRTGHPPYEFIIHFCSIFGLWPTIYDMLEVFTPYFIAPAVFLCLLWGYVVLYTPSTLERYRGSMYRFLVFFFLQSALNIGVIYYLMTISYHPGSLGVNIAGLVLHTIGAFFSITRLIQVRHSTEQESTILFPSSTIHVTLV